jgi:predicted component of viral defense system (DUF524 family)
MTVFNNTIKHDGGSHDVEVKVDGDQLVIRFGSSFTLRVDEKNADKLRELLYDGARELTIARRNTSDVYSEVEEISQEDLEAAQDMYNAINNKMDEMTEQMMNGPVTTTIKNKLHDWNPNDPSNW